MLKCYVDGRNIINGTPEQYKVADGAVFIENYNETLDSGTIILPHIDHKIEIEPYDVIVVFSTNEKISQKRLCVDKIICTQTSLDPAIYKYELTLFSETKLLEGVLLPSIAITKVIGITRSVWHYLDIYWKQYCPKTNSSEIRGLFGEKFTFGHNINNPQETVQSRFSNIECPEMQWNEPTFREVLNDLMMIGDCIPVVQNNVINFIDISNFLGEITANQRKNINYITESYASDDYVSELKMKIVNASNNVVDFNGDYPKNAVRKEEVILRSDGYIISTENCLIETGFPIWNVYKLYVSGSASRTYKQTSADGQTKTFVKTIDLDLTDYLFEYDEWRMKNIYYAGFGDTFPLSSQYQNTCLYYKRGSKNIFNLNGKQDTQFLWIKDQVAVVQLIIKKLVDELSQAIEDQANSEGYLVYEGTNYLPNWKNIKFSVYYDAVDECVFTAGKSNFPRNKRTVVDNQTNSYVDIQRQGTLEYLKANRLGNKIKLINGRYEKESDMPILAEKIDDSIIFRKEISVFENIVKVNYQATENYVLKDYFTSVKSKLRSWPIIKGEEAFVRADLIKYFINPNTMTTISNDNFDIPVYSTLEEYLSNFNFCYIFFYSSVGRRPNSTINIDGDTYNVNSFLVEFTKHISGNSVLFTIKMPSNTYVGKYISSTQQQKDKDDTHYGGMGQQNAIYVDGNGECTGFEIRFYKNKYYSTYAEELAKPIADFDNAYDLVYRSANYHYSKDQKEITQITIQFEINTNANDIFLGKK